MHGIFEDHGIRFAYPTDWEVEVDSDGAKTTVSLQRPDGVAFALVALDEARPDPASVASEVLDAMQEEYPDLDAAPALETIDGHRAVGHDLEFFSLDATSGCTIRCFRTDRRTVLVFGQWSDLEGESPSDQILRDPRLHGRDRRLTARPPRVISPCCRRSPAGRAAGPRAGPRRPSRATAAAARPRRGPRPLRRVRRARPMP